jgi:NAD(P)-dependent dehydrogenase (short-subunit alcohol dehydrogenase family)
VSHRFLDRVAVVTGAASGIGFAVAEAFAAEGAKVALLDNNRDGGAESVDAIRASGGQCEFFSADVGSESEVMRAVREVREAFKQIDHLVNNAGVVLVKPIEECTVSEWDHVMNVNVKSVFLTTKHLLGTLRNSKQPTIVNLGSVSSFVGQRHTPAYVASKGAVAMLSKTLALDLAEYGIRVNCVCPGITDTPMFRFHVMKTPDPEKTLRERCNRIPLNRMLSANDIARSVLYLSSPESAGVTGTTLVVDAGYLAAAEWNNNAN